MSVEFGVLGDVEVLADGELISVRGTRRQAILAVLLTEVNRLVPAEQIIDRVWGNGELPANPANALQTQITHLRRALAPVREVSVDWQATGYRLTAEDRRIDLHRFRQFVHTARAEPQDKDAASLFDQALALWRGEPFESLDTPWFAGQRAVLARERFAARLERADALLRLGEHAALLSELWGLAEAHPHDERLAGQLMLALCRSGQAADALACYHRLRTLLATELGTNPNTELQELYHGILTADPRLMLLGGRERGASGAVPRQLPAAPGSFVGRDHDLAVLTAYIASVRDACVPICALAGPGGIGKTWLALHWAHRHIDRFPDGQLFVDLRGFSPGAEPMPTETALRGLLEVFGVRAAQMPTALHAQSALFRSLIDGKRMLLVLDNAADTAQVAPLLPGSPTVTVLVTSRDQLPGLITGYGARHVPLDVLEDPEARTLLTAKCGRARLAAEPRATADLLAYCGGYPLALHIVTASATMRPDRSLAALAEELRDARLRALDSHDPMASVPAVLSWSRAALTDDQARAWMLLSLAPGPDISLAGGANVIGQPIAPTRTILRGLVQASLLQEDAHGRFQMHDLVRQYAADQAIHELAATDRNAALLRLIDFYLHTAHTGNELLYPTRLPIELGAVGQDTCPRVLADRAAALAWFDAENACLLATQQAAVAKGWHTSVWQLAWAMTSFHWRRGELHDNLAVWQAGLAATEHADDPAARATAYRHLGAALARAGQLDNALDHLRRALTESTKANDLAGQAETHRILSTVYEWRSEIRVALRHAGHAVALFRALDHPLGTANTLNAMGWFAAHLGDYSRANRCCTMSLALCREHGSKDDESAALDSLGYIAVRTGDYAGAVDHYRQALCLRRELGNTYEEANTLNGLANAHFAFGRLDEARVVWQQALALYRVQHRDADTNRVRRQLCALDRSA